MNKNLKEELALEGIGIAENDWSQQGSTYFLNIEGTILAGTCEDLVEMAKALGPQQDIKKVEEMFKSGKIKVIAN